MQNIRHTIREISSSKYIILFFTTTMPLCFAYSIINESYYLLLSPLVLLLAATILSRFPLTLLIFLFCPLYPPVIARAFNIPILNDVTFYLIILIIALLINTIFQKKYSLTTPPLKLFIFYLLVVILIGAIRVSINSYEISLIRSLVSNFIKMAIMISIYGFSYNYFRSTQNSKWIILLSITISIIITTFFLDKLMYGFSLQAKIHSGLFGTGNTVGNILVIILPLILFAHTQYRNTWLKALITATMITILLSQSRGSIVALIIMTAWHLYWTYMTNLLSRFLLVCCFLLCFVWINESSFFLELHGTLSHIDMSNMSDTSVGIDSSGRFTLWSRTYNYLQNPVHFLWGGGPNDFLNYSLHNTQNFLLKAWVDYGLLGLIAYLLFFIKVLFFAFHNRNNQASAYVILSALGVFCSGMFSHFDLGSIQLTGFWIITGIMFAEQKFHINKSSHSMLR